MKLVLSEIKKCWHKALYTCKRRTTDNALSFLAAKKKISGPIVSEIIKFTGNTLNCVLRGGRNDSYFI